MATFKVGQRIKKVRGVENIGVVAVVIGVASNRNQELYGDDLEVMPTSPMTFRNGRTECVSATIHSSQWEPIVDDGRKVTDWDAMNELGLSADNLLEVVKERVKERREPL